MIPVSVVVMTKDEEANIVKCLDSLRGFDQVLVVDSRSSDATATLAAQWGAEVHEFVWDGRYPKKKQWCLDNLPFRNGWVLYVDADEELTEELRAEIARLDLSAARSEAGFFVGYDYVFAGRPLRHGLRVFKLVLLDRARARFPEVDDLDVENMWEVEGHYQPILDGPVGRLSARMLHRDHSSLFHYFDRHNRYSDWEAHARGRDPAQGTQLRRRLLLQRLFERTPGRPLAIFLYSYVVQRGFLDGRAGFDFALSRAFYYWQVGLKRRAQRA